MKCAPLKNGRRESLERPIAIFQVEDEVFPLKGRLESRTNLILQYQSLKYDVGENYVLFNKSTETEYCSDCISIIVSKSKNSDKAIGPAGKTEPMRG